MLPCHCLAGAFDCRDGERGRRCPERTRRSITDGTRSIDQQPSLASRIIHALSHLIPQDLHHHFSRVHVLHSHPIIAGSGAGPGTSRCSEVATMPVRRPSRPRPITDSGTPAQCRFWTLESSLGRFQTRRRIVLLQSSLRFCKLFSRHCHELLQTSHRDHDKALLLSVRNLLYSGVVRAICRRTIDSTPRDR